MPALPDLFAALGDPTRFAIVERLLAEGELTAGELQRGTEISPPSVSRHLKVLRDAGLRRPPHRRVQPHLLRAAARGGAGRRLGDEPPRVLGGEPQAARAGADRGGEPPMTEPLRIAMTFPAPPELVFEFVTQRRRVRDWWGPEGMSLPDEALDFSRPGPWHSVIMNADGKRFKVSGRGHRGHAAACGRVHLGLARRDRRPRPREPGPHRAPPRRRRHRVRDDPFRPRRRREPRQPPPRLDLDARQARAPVPLTAPEETAAMQPTPSSPPRSGPPPAAP